VEVGLLHRPRLLELPLVVDGPLAVSEERDGGASAVRDVHAVDVAVVGDDGLHAGLPEDVLTAARALAGLHAEEVRVLELDEQARALAEVAPHRVVDDIERGRAPRPQNRGAGLQLQDEALLAADDLLADANRVGEEVGDRTGVEALQRGEASYTRSSNASSMWHAEHAAKDSRTGEGDEKVPGGIGGAGEAVRVRRATARRRIRATRPCRRCRRSSCGRP
jgi:hypothetical protein